MLPTGFDGRNRWLWPIALIALTLFALGMRWYYVSTAMVIHPVRGDAVQYVNYAWNLSAHSTFAKDPPGSPTITPDNYRDPAYPLFLASLMKVLGTGDAWYAAVLLCQALLGALTVTLTTQIGKFWLSSRWAICAGILMAVWPHSIVINGYLLTETLFGFLCALGLFLFGYAHRRDSIRGGFAAGATLGAAALTNAVLLPFGILLAALLAWRKLLPRKLCIALAAGALLLPGIWAVRNSQLPPSLSGGSSLNRALQNFAQGASPDFHTAYRDSFFGDAAAQARARVTMRTVDADYALWVSSPVKAGKAFLQRVGRQPLKYAFWYLLQKPYELWGWDIAIGQGDIYVYPTANSPFTNNHIWIAVEAACQSINFLLLLMAFASLIFVCSRRHFEKAFPVNLGNRVVLMSIFLLAAFISLVYSLLQAEPRYAIPYRSFEILLAFTSAAGASHFWRARATEDSRQAAILKPAHTSPIIEDWRS